MGDWEKLMSGKAFISDLGEDKVTQVSGEQTVMGRYAVWQPNGSRHLIVEVGSELEPLRKKHNIPNERICCVTI